MLGNGTPAPIDVESPARKPIHWERVGSIIGVRHEALALRKFSKCGTPRDVYAYQHLDAASIVEAAGKVLGETALDETSLTWQALRFIAERGGEPGAGRRSTAGSWQELWS